MEVLCGISGSPGETDVPVKSYVDVIGVTTKITLRWSEWSIKEKIKVYVRVM